MRSFVHVTLALVTCSLASCELFKPKEQQAAYDPYGQPAANPYGTAPANPYGQAPASNPYTQPPASNPYTQAPPANPYGGYEQPQTYTTPPASPYSSSPAAPTAGTGGGGGTVTVQPGDNLTKIARRNNTTISALRTANGLTSDLIRVGQKLNLP